MTKVIILGQEQTEPKKLKPIEFNKYVKGNGDADIATMVPSSYEVIELICKDYSSEYDIMFAHNDNRSCGCLYLGKFNDGVVEE